MRTLGKLSLFSTLFGSILAFSITKVNAQGSNLTPAYDRLFLIVTIISFVVMAIVITLFVWWVMKFAESNEATERKPMTHAFAKNLEIAWTGVAVAIVAILMITSYPVLFELDAITTADASGNEIDVIFEGTDNWEWIFHIPSQNITNSGERTSLGDFQGYITTLTLIKGVEYKFIFFASGNFIHSFYSPELSFKMDAIPGANNSISIVMEEIGTYNVFCVEFCGAGHSGMRGVITVVDA